MQNYPGWYKLIRILSLMQNWVIPPVLGKLSPISWALDSWALDIWAPDN